MDNPNAEELKTVCGDVIIDPAEHPSAAYNGKTVYFCGEGCLQTFEKDPDKYIASHNILPRDGE